MAVNFLINGQERLVPMAIEEPSVVAGASFMAKLAREGGGFQAHTSEPLMIGQMQIIGAPDLPAQEVMAWRDRIRDVEMYGGVLKLS